MMIVHPLDGHLKMSFSPRILHIFKLSGVVFALILTGYYLLAGPSGYSSNDYKQFYNVAVSGKKGAFVESALTTEIDGPFDNSTLIELCRSRTWTPGLIFKCEAPQGGIGNVRNVFLNCVRYAIEAGATAFIVPEIMARGTSLATLHTNVLVPFTHFFDLDHFTETLSTSCPQIHLYSHANDLWDKPSTAKAVILSPQDLSTSFIAETVLANPANWSIAFKSYLNASHPQPFSADKPVLVQLHNPLLQFPLSYDDPKFVANFGKILRFREDVRRLAGAVLYALSTKHSLSIPPTSSILLSKFYGAHLRTAADAQAAGWTPYSIQSANYLSGASHLNLSTIYLTSGNEEDVGRFAERAANISISVETKESLLGGEPPREILREDGKVVMGSRKGVKGFEREWNELQALTLDQQGLVDYEVLLRASAFGGTWETSFSWNVAMRRHVVAGGGSWTTFKGTKRSLDWHISDLSEELLEDAKGEWRMLKGRMERKIFGRANLVAGGAKEKAKEKGKVAPQAKAGEQSFMDELSVVFGPKGEGKMFELSMWP